MQLLVIDGNSIMNRAFYGIKLLTNKQGQFTNAITGFLNIYDKLLAQLQPTHVAVAFDLHAPTFRHTVYEAYKAGRKGMPEELRSQVPIIKTLLPLMGCTVVEREGYEADDILGTLSLAAVQAGIPCALATGDRDALQLVNEGVTVYLATTRETIVYDVPMVVATYGLTPKQLIDLKALMGDSSDNIPGVAGVGEKTAIRLLKQFGSLDKLYDQLETADLQESLKQKLREGKDKAYLSRELGTICRQVPIDTDLERYRLKPPQKAELAAELAKLDMYRLIEKWQLQTAANQVLEQNAPPVTYAQPADLDTVLSAVSRHRRLDLMPHLSGGRVAGCWVISPDAALMSWVDTIEGLVPLLTDPGVPKRIHDGKPLYHLLISRGEQPAGFGMDTALAAYLLNPLSTNYDPLRLAREYGIPVPEAGQPDQLSLEEIAAEGGDSKPGWQEAAVFPALADRLWEQLKQDPAGADLLLNMEIPLSQVLAEMEHTGVLVDKAGIAAFGETLQQGIDRLQQEIYDQVGYAFNLNSPKQLAKALFEDLGIPSGKKTKSGYSTSAEVLEKLRFHHPVVEMLLEYRTLTKLKTTYCDGLLKVVGPDGRIHSTFNQTETRTGRISSTEPNLQNIPVRSELGRNMRRFFKAADGCVLVDADYSQIELRVLAHMADEKTMKDAFLTGEDIHRKTAAQVFGLPEEMVTPQMRSSAKAINFGIIYGIGPHSLSEDLGVSYGQAKRYIQQYLAHYSGVAEFMERMVEQAKQTGYAVTLFGRRRPLPELRSSNANIRAFGERAARNTPIQGTAADIIKLAMIRVSRRLKQEGLRAKLILQVHDELIVESPLEEADLVSRLLKEEMEAAGQTEQGSMYLTVDVRQGSTWYETKE